MNMIIKITQNINTFNFYVAICCQSINCVVIQLGAEIVSYKTYAGSNLRSKVS